MFFFGLYFILNVLLGISEIVKPPPPPTPIEPAIKAAQQLSHSLDEVERKYEARLRKVEERVSALSNNLL